VHLNIKAKIGSL